MDTTYILEVCAAGYLGSNAQFVNGNKSQSAMMQSHEIPWQTRCLIPLSIG